MADQWHSNPAFAYRYTATAGVTRMKNPASTVLKVAHNGSLTSTSQEFLAAVHPQFAFVSAGFRNQFHHPRPKTLAKLSASHVSFYRTDLMGAVTLYLDGSRVTARTGPQN
jgi:competence protein ComEC